MVTDARIEETLTIGEKNKHTVELVHNWCAHASIKKMGGIGMVEQMSGLPIGHHAMHCPHAPVSGMATWDLADAALDFYDRNCVDCKLRKPVRIPSILNLVTARDEQRRLQRLEQERAEQVEASKLAARERVRQTIRNGLTTLPATTLDLISELDRERGSQAGDKLIQTARLAPESFTSPIIEHLFELIEACESSLVESALGALETLSVDKARLCNAALRNLFGARNVAARIIEQFAEHGDEELLAPALPALISMASPAHRPFFGEAPKPDPEPLLELYRKRPQSVRNGLKILLGRTEAHNAALAAQGIRVLSDEDTSLLHFANNELLAKLARAKWLAQGDEEEVLDALRDIRQTLCLAFQAAPQEIDSFVSDYLLGGVEGGNGRTVSFISRRFAPGATPTLL